MSQSARVRILPSRACKNKATWSISSPTTDQTRTTFSYFEKLPTEIVHKVARYLTDKDICSLLQTCKVAKEILEDDYVWLMRFLEHFDEPSDGRLALKINVRAVYKQRMMLLRGNVNFDDPLALENKVNRAALIAIKDLMIEAKPILHAEFGTHILPCSKNFSFLERVIDSSSILRRVPYVTGNLEIFNGQKPHHYDDERPKKRPKSEIEVNERALCNMHAYLYTIQLALTAYSLDPYKLNCELSYSSLAISQHAAYQASCTQSIFYGNAFTKVNVHWALQVVNFFRQHALVIDNPLFSHWEDLIQTELPQMWTQRLADLVYSPPIPKLGRVWKGTYAYLPRSEVQWLRTHDTIRRFPFDDQNITNLYPIQTMKLWIPENGRPTEYLSVWEDILKGKSLYNEPVRQLSKKATIPETQNVEMRKSVRDGTFAYDGIGYDDEEFYCVGHINPLPPQNHIPGFARMTMMKYFRTGNGQLDTNIMWAYEGVILPGGQIMIGRWWAPETSQNPREEYSGPFIMWCVDQSWDPKERENISNFRGLQPKAGPHDYIPGVNVPNSRH